MNNQRGMSLIELMVALALGLIITLGVMNIFLSARQTYTQQNSAAAMQEDARYLLARMSQELRMVGMYGCLGTFSDQSSNSTWTAAYNTPIKFAKDSTNGTVLTLLAGDVGNVGGTPTWTVLSDCISSATVYSGARTAAAGQMTFPVRQAVYTFKNNQIYTGTGTSQQVLISNVRDFSVLFGLAGADGKTVGSYSATVSDPSSIISVRLSLTISDPAGVLADKTYTVAVALRNRLR